MSDEPVDLLSNRFQPHGFGGWHQQYSRMLLVNLPLVGPEYPGLMPENETAVRCNEDSLVLSSIPEMLVIRIIISVNLLAAQYVMTS